MKIIKRSMLISLLSAYMQELELKLNSKPEENCPYWMELQRDYFFLKPK